MRNYFILFICIFILKTQCLFSQSILWEKSFGSNDDDNINCIINTSDGNFLSCGYANALNGDISNHYGFSGNSDFWVLKFDTIGNIIWSKCFGGTDLEQATAIIETSDKGICVLGYTYSNDFNVSGMHLPAFGTDADFWLVKLDSLGNLMWQKCIGGTSYDVGYAIAETVDSGLVVVGEADSNDGDVHNFHGGIADILAVKLDYSGNIVWSKTFGGTNGDLAFACKSLPDGSILIGADTQSNNGNISGNHFNGTSDIWIAKLDQTGSIIFSHCYGGTGDEDVFQLLTSSNGSFYICGLTTSNDGDVSGNSGISDMWFVKADSTGAIIWQKCYGGTDYDRCFGATSTEDGGFLLTGSSSSLDGISTSHHPGPGFDDLVVVKTDSSGNLEWSKCYGGSDEDIGNTACQGNNGKIYIGGNVKSSDFDVSFNHGKKDGWIFTIDHYTSQIFGITLPVSNLIGYITGENLRLNFNSIGANQIKIELLDILGRSVLNYYFKANAGYNEIQIPVSVSHGSYILSLTDKSMRNSITIVY